MRRQRRRREAAGRAHGRAVAGQPTAAVLLEEPTVEIREPFVEIRDTRSGDRIVTVIDVLSPSNKRSRTEGGRIYGETQQDVLRGGASLVEIDLLRGGEHVAAVSPGCAKRLPAHLARLLFRARR